MKHFWLKYVMFCMTIALLDHLSKRECHVLLLHIFYLYFCGDKLQHLKFWKYILPFVCYKFNVKNLNDFFILLLGWRQMLICFYPYGGNMMTLVIHRRWDPTDCFLSALRGREKRNPKNPQDLCISLLCKCLCVFSPQYGAIT